MNNKNKIQTVHFVVFFNEWNIFLSHTNFGQQVLQTVAKKFEYAQRLQEKFGVDKQSASWNNNFQINSAP